MFYTSADFKAIVALKTNVVIVDVASERQLSRIQWVSPAIFISFLFACENAWVVHGVDLYVLGSSSWSLSYS